MKKLTKLLNNQGQACPYLSRHLLRLFLFIALLTMGGTNRVWAEEVTFTINNSSAEVMKNEISLSGGKASSNGYVFDGSATSGTITISSPTKTITKIDFTYASNENDRTGGGTSVTTEGYSYTAGSTTATWTGSSSSVGIQYVNKVRITQMVVTYTAGGAPTTYALSYNLLGHGNAIAGANVSALPNPLPIPTAHIGYAFGGWYTKSDCQTVATAGSAISGATTLCAKWTTTGVPASTDQIFSLSVSSSSPINVAAGGNVTDFSTYAVVSGGSIEKVHNGHANTAADMIVSSGIDLAGSGGSYVELTLNENLQAGDVIYISSTSGVFKLSKTASNNNVNYTAADGKYIVAEGDQLIGQNKIFIWKEGGRYVKTVEVLREATSFTITYNTNGGTQSEPTEVTKQLTLPSTFPLPTKAGNVFGGWYTDSECTTLAVKNAAISAHTILYAKWTEQNYSTDANNLVEIPVGTTISLIDVVPNTPIASADNTIKRGFDKKNSVFANNYLQYVSTDGYNNRGTKNYEDGSSYTPIIDIKNSGRELKFKLPADCKLTIYGSDPSVQQDRTWHLTNSSGVVVVTEQNAYCFTCNISQADTYTLTTTTSNTTLQLAAIKVAPAVELYTVTYSNDSDKGNCGTTTFTQTSAGQGTSLPGATPRPGYTFHGWDTNGDGTADVHASAAYTPTRDITLTAVYTNTNVVGDANEGWWTAFSNFVELPKDKSIHLTFNNQCHGTATYNNWAMVVTTDANGHNGDGVQSGMGNELYFIRPNGESLDRSHTWTLYKENAGHYTEVTLSGDEETAYKAAMANADVDIQVSFDGTSIYTIAKTSASNGTKYILVDKSTNNSTNYENVYVSFTVDKCVLTFNTQNDATPSINVAVQSNDNVKGGVAAKIASGIQLPSDRPIWAGTEVVFQATPAAGYTLVNWTDEASNVISTQTDFTKAIEANVTYTANFAANYSYTVNAVDGSGNVLKELKADNAIANSNVTVYYPAFILKNGVMYENTKNPSHPDYGTTFTVDANNKVVNITYTATDKENVIAYYEGEELPGAASAQLTAVSSNGYLGRYTDGNYHQIMTLDQGKYKIYGYARSGNGSGSYNYSFKSGSVEVLSGSIVTNNIFQTIESDEFSVTDNNTALNVQINGGNATGIDFLYIVKTGDYTPALDYKVNITFTSEDKQAVSVVSTPNYGVTASVANGNMTPDGTALKMETSTAVTITIPAGYTATMKFTASNNGGIKVTNASTSVTTQQAASQTWNLEAGTTYTIEKGNSLNVSMITLQLTPLATEVAALTSVTSSAQNVEVTPAGNNVWGVVVPADYVGETVPVTLNYEHATEFTVKKNDVTQTPTASGEGTATFNFNIGTQVAPVSYTVTTGNNAGSQNYTINVLKLGQEYEKVINVTDFNYYVGTSGVSANDNGLDRDLNGVNFTFTGGQGVKVNNENLITVRRRSSDVGQVTIALNGSNTGAHITKVVLVGSGFTAEAANYLTMTNGHITYRNSTELMVVPTTQTNTITFQSNGTDVNFTAFKIYTDAALSFTKVTPTASISDVADHILVNSTVTPTLTTSPKNFKMAWTYVTNKSNSTIDANSGIIAVGGKESTTDKIRAKFAGNDFYNQVSVDKAFNTVKASAPTITIASGFKDGETVEGTFAITLAATGASAIYYTTDGTEPTKTSGTLYSSPFNIEFTRTIKAIAVYNVSGTEVISDITTKRFNYKDPSLYKQKYVEKVTDSNAESIGLVKTPTVTSSTNYNMTDKILQYGGQDACVLSWGSYTWCSPNSSNGNKIDGTVRGTYSSLTEQPGKTQAIDGYVNTISTNNNPRSEAGAGYNDACAKGNDPLNLPVLGSFARFQPLYNGTITVWILQNGSSDWHYYDDIDEKHSRIPEGSAKKDESYQLDKLRRRPTYICDEFGTALSNGEDGNEAVVHATLADDAKFEPKTFNAIASAVYGTQTSSQYKAAETYLYDPETNVSTLPTDYSSQAIIDYWHGLIKARGWTAGGAMNVAGNNTGLVLTPNNGFELMIKQYVKYTFPVIAGKSYYVVGSGTNNSFCAAQFQRSNDDVDVNASPIVISEYEIESDVASNITAKIGQQVNVELRRTFTAGKWYSLVLPFSMNDVQVKQYFGDNAAIYWFDSTDSEGNIHWVKHHYQMINAGIPVLIKVTKDFTSGSQIKNVLIQTDQIREYGFGGDYVMTGTWTPTTMPENCYYISNTQSSNPDGKTYEATIYRTAKTTSTNGLRAWVRPNVANAKRLTGISFASFLAEEDFDIPTSISEVLEGTDEIVTSALSNDALFNIGGQRISATSFNSLPKGVYIQNGKKFIKK